MTSQLVHTRLEREGLLPVLERRAAGEVPSGSAVTALLERVEILALGAAADLATRRECGEEVRIYVPVAPEGSMVISAGETARGTAFLRRLATLRLTGPIGLRVVIDFGVLGLEIAQVALSFGATDLAGPIASRRGLPLVGTTSSDAKSLVKKRELLAYVERAQKKPVFVADGAREKTSLSSVSPQNPRQHADS